MILAVAHGSKTQGTRDTYQRAVIVHALVMALFELSAMRKVMHTCTVGEYRQRYGRHHSGQFHVELTQVTP